MTATLFLAFVALTAAAVVALSARYLNGRTAFTVTGGFFVWSFMSAYWDISA